MDVLNASGAISSASVLNFAPYQYLLQHLHAHTLATTAANATANTVQSSNTANSSSAEMTPAALKELSKARIH